MFCLCLKSFTAIIVFHYFSFSFIISHYFSLFFHCFSFASFFSLFFIRFILCIVFHSFQFHHNMAIIRTFSERHLDELPCDGVRAHLRNRQPDPARPNLATSHSTLRRNGIHPPLQVWLKFIDTHGVGGGGCTSCTPLKRLRKIGS